jgi:hypothetical protein
VHHSDAIRVITALEAGKQGVVTWVSPVLSACVAAWVATRRSVRPDILFTTNCEDYARYNGLIEILEGQASPAPRSGRLAGKTYTPLASLLSHPEVDACNALIGGVVRERLTGHPRTLTRGILKVIGELHDNVASHSRGRGYSAAQVYDGRLEFAIADAGCGLLRNARRADSSIETDAQAIDWAMREGTTSAQPQDDWGQSDPEQRMFGDASPGDNHQGLGLWELQKLVRDTGGTLWVATGSARALYGPTGGPVLSTGTPAWAGLAIEVLIPLAAPGSVQG